MEKLFIDGLPRQTRNGAIFQLLVEQGRLAQQRIGRIDVQGTFATVEVADGWSGRVARRIDGAQIGRRHIRAWRDATEQINDPHFDQMKRWLKLEADAEQAQFETDKHHSENSLQRLVIKEESIGLGGRSLVLLTPRNDQADLPWTNLGVGSPVLLSEEGSDSKTSWRGVITQLRTRQVEIALTHLPESTADRPQYRVDLSSDAIGRQRMERALMRVVSAESNRLAELRDILLGHAAPMFGSTMPIASDIVANLNNAQHAAVTHALSAQDVAVIHGPPGTGKTTTLVAVIRAALRQGDRVLACAPSNLAVDNLCESLLAVGEPIVRLGHPARVTPQVQAHTLDALVEQHSDFRLARKLRREAAALLSEAGKFRRTRPEKGAKQALRQEADALFDEARQLEVNAVERVLDGATVVLATLTGLDSALIGQRQFDLCVIDEAGQSTEPATWIPVPRSRRLVLAGDHQQLPPTILSPQAEREGFGISLLECIMVRDGATVARCLDEQYRMHRDIMAFSSAEFYDDTLIAHAAVADHLLCDLDGVSADVLTTTPVTFIDTAGAGYDEEEEPDGQSRLNPQEAELVARKVSDLLNAGVTPEQIGIITPYSAQVRTLRMLLPETVEVNSVDGFQGREKECIVISLVRSNSKGDVGFLAETRRMNVALTRARRKLIVIGDSATVTADPFYARLIEHWEAIGAYHSVWEEWSA
ncbi:MAG: AAA domain-containing protein [Anaerolineae bacterium]|nr:AAA domain-containing protein [Anaerolineae bacterium]